ncbi:MAG: sigma 54-interacting transcriptional regulator [Bilophila wadsworthia]
MSLCPELAEVRQRIELAAPTRTTVLILGETGSGKESVADAIHERSDRRNGPFLKVNCGTITPSLLSSELFGHEKGAFTGAHTTRRGYFEQANGGTLFLDEIGEMPQEAQVHLLRVLESRYVTRVGDHRPIPVDVRVIAATQTDLMKKVREGTFRKDLWFRLAVLTIVIPPLRDRKADIPALVRHFLRTKAAQFEMRCWTRRPRAGAAVQP